MQYNFSHVYFIGVGGIGMSALARYFKAIGKEVAGYDRTETVLTKQLVQEGISIIYTDAENLIAEDYKDKTNTLIVYTPAIPRDSIILNWFKNNNFDMKKRAEVLGLITKAQQSICIAGTHGKTTITTMTSHLLYSSKVGCNAFLGGISLNYDSNFLRNTDSNKVVIEADEFDYSFLQLYPHTAIISAIDADHLDIYGTHQHLIDSFSKFTSQITEGGNLIIKDSLKLDTKIKSDVKQYTYNIESGDFHVENLKLIDGLYNFDFITPEEKITNITLGIPGRVNVENAVAALAAAYLHGVSADKLRENLSSFKGIKRRFQYQVRQANCAYIDDYAHHPEELRATINSVRSIYPNKKIIGIFQPHLYSRTQDFAPEFAAALSLLDELWMMDIYPARELPIPSVNSEIILKDVSCKSELLNANQIFEKIKETEIEILLTLGAGDIDLLVPEITNLLKTKKQK